MPTPPAQSQADLGIVLRIVIERSVNRLDALFLQALALQLPFCFEVRAPSDRLVSSAPE